MATSGSQWFLWTATILLIAVVSQGQLTTDFYESTCPQAATIVKQKVDEIVDADKGMAAGLMRLHFHDCFVRVSSLSECSCQIAVATQNCIENWFVLQDLFGSLHD